MLPYMVLPLMAQPWRPTSQALKTKAGLREIVGHLSCSISFTSSAGYILMRGKGLPRQLICSDVACSSLRSSHAPLISGDILDTAVIGGDSVDGRTPWK